MIWIFFSISGYIISFAPQGDDQLDTLQSQVGAKRPRGWPGLEDKLKLTVPMNNRLPLQLHAIREDTGCSLASLQTSCDEVSISAGVPGQNVCHLIQTCLCRLDVRSKKTNNDISSFLNKGLEMEWIGVSKDCYLRSTLASPTLPWQQWSLSQMGSCWNWIISE